MKIKKNTARPTMPNIFADFFAETEEPVQETAIETAPTPKPDADSPLRYISFGSGSSGNCAYVGRSDGGILIDAGIDPDKVFDTLATNGVTPEMVKAVCLTHDHGDHIRYVYGVVRRYKHIRVYCTMRLMNGLLRRHNISRRIKDYQETIFHEIPFKIGSLTITSFSVPHDGTDNCGFFIEAGEQKMAIATDIGHVAERAAHYLSLAQYVVLESNYDRKMLDDGYYPAYLKNRIRATNGHLDNEDAAKFVASIVGNKVMKYLFLCHLSHDNNTPDIARRVMKEAIEAQGVTVGDGSHTVKERNKDLQLVILPRFDSSLFYIF